MKANDEDDIFLENVASKYAEVDDKDVILIKRTGVLSANAFCRGAQQKQVLKGVVMHLTQKPSVKI